MVPIPQGCGSDSWPGQVEEATNECINKILKRNKKRNQVAQQIQYSFYGIKTLLTFNLTSDHHGINNDSEIS